MTLAACGHTVDLWLTSPHLICKPCFEKQGFVYNRNSFRDCDRLRVRLAAVTEPLPTKAERERRSARMRRAAA